MAGYNACCIAYGQTGSGKTYTMLGSPLSLEASSTNASACHSQLGLAPRVFKEVFQVTSPLYQDSFCRFLLAPSRACDLTHFQAVSIPVLVGQTPQPH